MLDMWKFGQQHILSDHCIQPNTNTISSNCLRLAMEIEVKDGCRGDLFRALVVGLYFLIAADAAGVCIRP